MTSGQEYLAALLATAAGGFDPTPMLIMAAALGVGVRRRHVVGATTLLLGGTALWGFLLTRLIGPQLLNVEWHALVRQGRTAAWMELGLALGLAVYVVIRVVAQCRGRLEQPDPSRPHSAWGLYLTMTAYVGIVIFDIPFDLFVAATASQQTGPAAAGWLGWAVLSQFPVTVLAVMTLLGRHHRVVEVTTRWWARMRPYARGGVTIVLALAALVMVLDAGRWLLFGHFLIG